MPCSLTEAGCRGGPGAAPGPQARRAPLPGLKGPGRAQISLLLALLRTVLWRRSTAPKGPPARKQLFEWNRDAGCDRAWRRLETHKDLPSAAHGTIRAIYLLLSQLAQVLGCSRTD